MVIFNQQNYPKSYLGNTKFTLARWGCLDTVITMIYDFINGKEMTPDTMAMKLSFLDTGDLVWGSLSKVGLKLKSRVRTYRKDLIDLSYKNPDEFIALQVKGSHWVWVIGRYIPILGYKIVDPLGGKKRYTNYYENKITGHAVIVVN